MVNFLLALLASFIAASILSLFGFIVKRLNTRPKWTRELLIKRRTLQAYIFLPVGLAFLFAAGVLYSTLWLFFILLTLAWVSFVWGGTGVVFLAETAKYLDEKLMERIENH